MRLRRRNIRVSAKRVRESSLVYAFLHEFCAHTGHNVVDDMPVRRLRVLGHCELVAHDATRAVRAQSLL